MSEETNKSAPPPTLDEMWDRMIGEAAQAERDLAVAEARIEGFLLYQNLMPRPEEPQEPQPKTLTEALGDLTGSVPPGSKLPPSASETETCPNCHSTHFFKRSNAHGEAGSPASMCFTCGWTPLFYQDPEAPAVPSVLERVDDRPSRRKFLDRFPGRKS